VQQYIGPAISGVAQRLLGDQADRFFGLYQLKPLHTQFKPNPTQPNTNNRYTSEVTT
jgi:hypothetical protein